MFQRATYQIIVTKKTVCMIIFNKYYIKKKCFTDDFGSENRISL